MSARIGKALERHRELGEETKTKIISLITRSEPSGMTTNELVKATGRNRRTIHGICRGYMKSGVLNNKKGRFGKYHLGPSAAEDPGLAAFFFQEKVMKRFKETWVSSRFCDKELSKRIVSELIPEDIPIENVVCSKDLDELFLFEYALKIGAIITYMLTQSIRYTQKPPNIPDLSGAKKSDLIIKWLDNAIEPMLLIQTFRKLAPVLNRLKPETGNAQEDAKLSWLELKDGQFKELENIYRNTFPDLFEDLEKIRTNIPDQINTHQHILSKSERQY